MQARLDRSGLRRTLATRAVLDLFLSHPHGMFSHAQAQTALAARGLAVNRVTLYRLLDRLASCGVLQRHPDAAARSWRFGLAEPVPDAAAADVVPRFECDACHRQWHLSAANAPTHAVAGELLRTLAGLGHQGQRVDLSIHGTCAACVLPSPLPSPAGGRAG
ncbi:Fur family transcriptional regulator [Hydrogenophaga sp.]|uniref:Fur family transcriptional regulator n=1 Tax=Hydrogenophaga sp. TaxID=1904254 RepID=UPI0019B878F1|nr:Fur family transcriptional regulator [Hydrogenophaga sp.]MBD3892483.1 Fur family transcriptional regulator [Hydrogenophaga sp.]